MYKVLIIEDESWIRKGLIAEIDWDGLGLELIGEAENGKQAGAFVAKNSVDIIILDMEMPVLDGKQFLRELERQQINCEIIVTSKFTDFEYMKQAIHAQVVDYLLKPIEEKDLNKALFTAKAKIERKMMRGLDHHVGNWLNDLYYRATLEEAFNQSSDDSAKNCQADCFFAVALILTQEIIEYPGLYNQIKAITVKSAVKGIENFGLFAYKESKDLYCLIVQFKEKIDKGLLLQLWQEYLSGLTSGSTGGVRIGTCGINVQETTLHQAIDKGRKALQFLKQAESAVILFDQIQEELTVGDIVSLEEEQIYGLVTAGKESVWQHLESKIKKDLRTEEYCFLPTIKKTLIHLTLTLESCCHRLGYSFDINQYLSQNYIDYINKINWWSAVEEYLGILFDYSFSAINRPSDNKNVIDEITDYLRTHYYEDINLLSISNNYHFSYIYLSRLFKEQTGQNFTNYLLEIRMREARRLMVEERFKVKEAARLVGYSNEYYFSQSYKKYYGVSPIMDQERSGS